MKRELQLIPDHESRAGIYHVTSRAVWKTFIFDSAGKEFLRQTMRNYEVFCGVRVLTFCLMSNHIHILVEVPPKQDAEALLDAPDEEFFKRLGPIYSVDFVEQMRMLVEKTREDGIEGDKQGLTNDEGVSAGVLADRYIRSLKANKKRIKKACPFMEKDLVLCFIIC